MKERAETRSENAHHIILKYEDNLYHVDRVTVQCSERKEMYKVVFSAKRLEDSKLLNLDFDISPNIYDVLVKYTNLDNSDLLLILDFEGNIVKWRFVRESWLQQQRKRKLSKYVV
jgi:hypothetical protein